MIGDYPTQLDEIDQWLFDSFGIIPGACSSTENLRYTTARMVAEVLWPKKDLPLTIDDIRKDALFEWVERQDALCSQLPQTDTIVGERMAYQKIIGKLKSM